MSARDRNEPADPFAHRAGDYATANAARPDARRAERDRLLAPLPLGALRCLVDLQAASGYVGRGLLERAQRPPRLASVEPSPELVRQLAPALGPVLAPLHALPFASASVDAVLCLAGTHHAPALAPILAEALRVLRPGGWISIAEAETDDGPADFLNGFVDRWSEDGHDGRFVAPGELAAGLRGAGFREVDEEACAVPWRFDDREALVGFCRTLFGVGRAPPEELERELAARVGIEVGPGDAKLCWRLRYAVGRAPGA